MIFAVFIIPSIYQLF